MRDDALGRVDLRLQRGEIDRGDNDIGGERQVRRLELEALVLRQRFLAFDLAPNAAENVGRIGDVERRRGDAVAGSTAPVGPCDASDTCCCCAGSAGAQGREQAALLGEEVLARLTECRLRGIDVGIGLQRLLDQRVELRRVEQRPPFAGNVLLRDKVCAAPPGPAAELVCGASASGV